MRSACVEGFEGLAPSCLMCRHRRGVLRACWVGAHVLCPLDTGFDAEHVVPPSTCPGKPGMLAAGANTSLPGILETNINAPLKYPYLINVRRSMLSAPLAQS